MSDYGYAVWGFAASILSTVFLVPLAYALMSGGMPTAQMRELDALLSETEVLLSSAIREGIIDYRQYELTLNGDIAKAEVDNLRAQVYNINGFWEEFWCWIRGGLSGAFNKAMKELHRLRGEIATRSSRGRVKLEKMGCTVNPILVVYSKESISHLVLSTPTPTIAAMLPLRVDHDPNSQPGDLVAAPMVPSSRNTHLPATTASHATYASLPRVTEHTTLQAIPSSATALDTLPPLVFSPDTQASTKNQRRARRDVLAGFTQKLNRSTDARATWESVTPATLEGNRRLSRLRGKFVGFFRGSDTTLPRHTGFFPFPYSSPDPFSKASIDDASHLDEKVVAQM
ncbi:hypothetical protein C8Q74DRAFT_1363993 [Fomes fomentarius]|nr:hypothetical protein C8Q74DRAFT_1363993 [Fomes fomentarius]